MLQLGGPVVAFLIVIILGFWLAPAASNFPLTVYAHGAGGPQDLVLRGSGYIIIDTAGLRRQALIGNDGEAFFPEVPANFRGQKVPVALDADGYQPVDLHQEAHLTGASVYVEVRKKPGRIRGYVAEQNPDSYRPYLANTLNDLGDLDTAQNQMAEARAHYLEVIGIYKELSKRDPNGYAADIARVESALAKL